MFGGGTLEETKKNEHFWSAIERAASEVVDGAENVNLTKIKALGFCLNNFQGTGMCQILFCLTLKYHNLQHLRFLPSCVAELTLYHFF